MRKQVWHKLGFLLLLIVPILSTRGAARIYPESGIRSPAAQNHPDNTIRVNVGLVQTDVMVFDGRGHFVPDLGMDQFELWVDGKVQPISFLEAVSAGSPLDEEIWAGAEGKPGPPPDPAGAVPNPGRTILFFLDDWHMAAGNLVRARAAMSNLIRTAISPKNRMAVFAASGQLGSALEFTGNRSNLLARLETFKFQNAGAQDLQWPPMSEAQAYLIEQGDKDVIGYFADAMQKTDSYRARMRDPNGSLDAGLVQVIQHRAADVANSSAGIGARTLSALRDLIGACAELPGRKAIFFLSDGFVLQPQRGDIVDGLRQVTSSAARRGIVIYSLDTRGLVVGMPDAKSKRAPDAKGYLARSGYNEILSQQDALNALASDTGGRFLRDTNALDTAMMTTLAETSRYYLLAWPFDPDAVKPGRYSTIRVAVKGRPGLTVRVRQGSLDLSQLVSGRKPSQF